MASVGSVYAKAVYEVAQDSGQMDRAFKDLKSFLEALNGHSALKEALSGAGINPQSRRAILDQVASSMELGDTAKRLLTLLANKGRMAYLGAIVSELEAMIERAQGIIPGRVRTAVELSQEELSVLSASLAKRVGGRVKLSQTVDPNLLGGVVATVAGRTFDASLRTQIERFKSELI
jgi:F-type H+-transporting ATPase subunit delta